ncbi:MAG: hypothetical protein ACREOU_15325 [Candidatus Eiseniibacteriota bacterium]
MTKNGGGELADLAQAYAACTRCADLGVPPDPRRDVFFRLADAVRPSTVQVLFIAESPPQRNRRGRWSYFFLPEERPPGEDPSTLFWALAEVLALPEACGVTYRDAFRSRSEWKPRLLAEFRRRGFWLVDAAKCAVNGVADERRRRDAVVRCAESWLWRELRLLDPAHVVLIKANVRDLIEPLLVRWGFGPRIVGTERIPHPGSGQRANFRRLMQRLIGRHPGLFGPPGV